MKLPDPALLDLPGPSGAAIIGSGGSCALATGEAAPGHDPGAVGAGEPEPGLLRLGPLTLTTGGMEARLRLRQRVRLSDKLAASAGVYYSLTHDRIGPTGSLTYMLDDRTRLEVNERRAFIKRRWAWSSRHLSLGIGAECSVTHAGLPPGARRKPELHLSLDHITPRRWEALGVGLVLLANLPFTLRDQEGERPTVSRALLGYARGTLRRAGYAAFRLDVSEVSGVLDL